MLKRFKQKKRLIRNLKVENLALRIRVEELESVYIRPSSSLVKVGGFNFVCPECLEQFDIPSPIMICPYCNSTDLIAKKTIFLEIS